jgi:hypothetical protein
MTTSTYANMDASANAPQTAAQPHLRCPHSGAAKPANSETCSYESRSVSAAYSLLTLFTPRAWCNTLAFIWHHWLQFKHTAAYDLLDPPP